MSEMLGEGAVRRQRIVVGVDPDANCRRALRHALRLCAPPGASELHIVHALRVSPHLRDGQHVGELASLLRASVAQLRECASGIGRALGPELVFHVRVGDAAEALHQIATETGADLIVVCGGPRSAGQPFASGSVAGLLCRIAEAPLLVPRPCVCERTRPRSGPERHAASARRGSRG
jgi:nucleotide-binding universal stress UspA family protein